MNHKTIFIYFVAASIHAQMIEWVAQNPNNDMNNPANWSPNTIPGNTDDAIFDSTVPGVNLTPTENSVTFSVSTFNFPSTASDFDFHFNNQNLSFQGIGITGAFTDPTINKSNINNSLFAGNLIAFMGSQGTSGSSNIIDENSATLTGNVSNTILSNIASNFYSTGPFTIADNGSIVVSNTGNDSSNGTGNNQVAVTNSAQMFLSSTLTVGNHCAITISNTGIDSSHTTINSDFIGYINDQQLFVSDVFQAGDAFTLTVTNTGIDSGSGLKGADVAVITSNSGTTGQQILFQQGGTIGNNGTVIVTNNGDSSGAYTGPGARVALMNLQQVAIGDSMTPGAHSFTAGDHFNLNVSTFGNGSSHGRGGDVVGVVSTDQVILYTPCSLGNNATITLSASGNFSGNTTTSFVNVGTVGNNQLQCISTFEAGDNFSLNAANSGTNTGTGSGGYFIGDIINGQQVAFNNGLAVGNNASLNIANSGSNSSSTSQANQIGSLMGYGKQLYVQEQFQAGDDLQIVITNSGFDNSTGAGGNYVGFLNNNTADNSASQFHLSSGAIVGNSGSISLSNIGTYQGSNANPNTIGVLAGQQLCSIGPFQAGDNFNLTVSNLGTNNSSQNSNSVGTIGGEQVEFGDLCVLGNNASLVLSNSGINLDSVGSSNSIGVVNGSQCLMLGDFTAGVNLNIEISNLSTNAGDSSNFVGYVFASQLEFQQDCTLNDGTNITVFNSGDVRDSQILFGQGFTMASGKARIAVTNNDIVGAFGIDVQGANSGGNALIVLGNSSLYVETTLPTFTIGGLDGDVTSTVQSQPTLNINTDASTTATFMGSIEDFPAITSTLIKAGVGVQTLGGVNTFTGETTVQEGTLVLTGSLAGDAATNPFGTLEGTGTIQGTFTNTGTVAPGLSIGTLTVGNYINNGGTYEVEINGPQQSDLILVLGTATLNGGPVNVILLGETFTFQQPYTIVTANGGVTGTYTGAISSGFIDPILTYDPNHVYLTIEAALSKAASTCNQSGVAQILDSLVLPNAQQTLLISSIALLPLNEAKRALESLSGFQYTNEVWVTENSTKRFLRRLYDPLRFLIPCCEPLTWLETGYSHARSSGKNARSTNINSWQATCGLQKTFLPNFTLGVAGSYEYDNIHYRGAKECSNTLFLATYALYRSWILYELIDIAYSHDSSSMTRLIQIGNSSYKASSTPNFNTFAFYNETGCDISLYNFLFQPFLGFQLTSTNRNHFNEIQANGWGLTFNEDTWSSFIARLGFHISTQTFLPLSLDLAFNTLLTNPNTSTQGRFTQFGTPFLICGNRLDNCTIDYSFTLFTPLYEKLSGYLVLSGASGSRTHTFDLSLGLKAFW